jgi:UPF0755 protein
MRIPTNPSLFWLEVSCSVKYPEMGIFSCIRWYNLLYTISIYFHFSLFSFLCAMKKFRFLKPWRLFVFVLLLVFLKLLFFSNSFELYEKITIEKWDSIQKVYTTMSTISSLKTRWYLKNHTDTLQPLELWEYIFSGSYSPETLIEVINNGPLRVFSKIRILEWWSIYDIDAYLTQRWYSIAWEYIAYVSDATYIHSLSSQYDFIDKFIQSKPKNWWNLTLEGLLYPDTYHLDPHQPIIKQLVKIQVATFDKKVYTPYRSQIASFSKKLREQWYEFSLGLYNIVTLASIIEKEERSSKNKPVIAGIFLNRLNNNMQIGADITLCYGLKTWYESCTSSVIADSVHDDTNLYNTRIKNWLTPTPIANSSLRTFDALLNFEKTSYFYYLHDSEWQIRYASDLQGHNNNISKHL